MRPTNIEYNEKVEKRIHDSIASLWSRISCEAALQGKSLGALAYDCGISASAVYAAVRKVEESKLEYIDTTVSQISVLAKHLGLPLDRVVLGDTSYHNETMAEELTDLLSRLPEPFLDKLKFQIISKITL